MWPIEQDFIDQSSSSALISKAEDAFTACVQAQKIDADLGRYLNDVYLPLAAWLVRRKEGKGTPLVVGICGGQGSGKSTATALVSCVLEQRFSCRVASLSIDDIYKTRLERESMGREVHPLFVTRGVPGTHDVELGLKTIERLCQQTENQITQLPRFDKSRDDRMNIEQWPTFAGRPDIIILEGWCVGAVAEPENVLSAPINLLERDEDTLGQWRREVNEALATEYQKLFGKLDVLMLLKVESMKKVFTWRRLQERKLAEKVATAKDGSDDLRVMSKKEVDRFIMHYERITRHILQEMPTRADIVFPIDNSHNPATVIINKPIT